MAPKRRFGTSKKMWVRHFVSSFHTSKYYFMAKIDEKCLQNALPHLCFDVPKSSFGEHNIHCGEQKSRTFRPRSKVA